MHARSKRVAVVGNGIVGLLCALTLREHGHEVLVVDPRRAGSSEGVASYGNAGVVSPWSCVPQCLPGTWKQIPGWLLDSKGPVRVRWPHLPVLAPWALRFLANCRESRVNAIADAMDALMQGNISAYRGYLSGTGQEDLLQDSWYLNVYRGRQRPDSADLPWTLRQERGATIEFVDRKSLTDLEPAIGPDYHSAVIIKQQSRIRSPGRLCEALADKAQENGVTFLRARVLQLVAGEQTQLEISPLEGQMPVTVDHSRNRITVDRTILCAGMGSASLVKAMGYRMPLMSERGYHLEFLDPGVSLNHSIQDMAGKFVVSDMIGGIRTAGTAEFASDEALPDYRRAEIFRSLTRRLLPDLNTLETRHWMGVRPSFPDNLPAIGALSRHPSVIAAFGHSHYGMGMAPATARLVAAIVNGDTANIDTTPYRPERFH